MLVSCIVRPSPICRAPRRRARSRTAAAVLALVATAGCFSYAPINGHEPAPRLGTEVRAHLSTPESFQLTNVTANNVVEVDGEVVRWEDERLVLSAWWLRALNGTEHRGIGETVNIPTSSLGTVERKRVSVAKTGALAGFGVLLAVLFNSALTSGAGGGEGPGPPPPPQQ